MLIFSKYVTLTVIISIWTKTQQLCVCLYVIVADPTTRATLKSALGVKSTDNQIHEKPCVSVDNAFSRN